MQLQDLKSNWERLAQGDAFHSILYRPEMNDGGWDADTFFRTGATEIDALMVDLAAMGIVHGRDRALDFGCAAGRLAQGMKAHFQRVAGVDISSAMLEHARRFNKHGDDCTYYLNTEPHLRIFPSDEFDLLYSNITLQHNEPRYIESYIRDFIRIVKPGGIIVFQLPSRCIDSLRHRIRIQAPYPIKKLYWRMKARLFGGSGGDDKIVMPMYAIRRPRVERLIADAGGRLLQVRPNDCAGDSYESFWYYVTK